MSCGVGRRCGSDPGLLWLWCRPAATAPNLPLAWELPYATGAALKRLKKKKKKKKRRERDMKQSARPHGGGSESQDWTRTAVAQVHPPARRLCLIGNRLGSQDTPPSPPHTHCRASIMWAQGSPLPLPGGHISRCQDRIRKVWL